MTQSNGDNVGNSDQESLLRRGARVQQEGCMGERRRMHWFRSPEGGVFSIHYESR